MSDRNTLSHHLFSLVIIHRRRKQLRLLNSELGIRFLKLKKTDAFKNISRIEITTQNIKLVEKISAFNQNIEKLTTAMMIALTRKVF